MHPQQVSKVAPVASDTRPRCRHCIIRHWRGNRRPSAMADPAAATLIHPRDHQQPGAHKNTRSHRSSLRRKLSTLEQPTPSTLNPKRQVTQQQRRLDTLRATRPHEDVTRLLTLIPPHLRRSHGRINAHAPSHLSCTAQGHHELHRWFAAEHRQQPQPPRAPPAVPGPTRPGISDRCRRRGKRR